MNYTELLIQIGKDMKEKSNIYHKKLSRSPKGTLQVTQSNGYLKIYQLLNEDGHYTRIGIKKQDNVIRALVRKAYLQETVTRLDKNIDILRSAIKEMDDMNQASILSAMPTNYHQLDEKYKTDWIPDDMHPVFTDTVPVRGFTLYVSEDIIDSWGSMPYRANTIQVQTIKHRTENGIYMRSKSEISIFGIYKQLGIPVHYDEIVSFNGTIKSPDFISMRYDGKLIYHEHCGRVFDSEYMENHDKKIQLYKDLGIVPWDNLIVSYETADGGIDLQLTEAEIRAKHKL